MSPLATACFIFIGMGIMLVSPEKQSRFRLIAAEMSGCVVAVIASVALFGFIFAIETATGWGSYSRIAVNTSVVFLVLGLGLMAWSSQRARRENFSFPGWLSVAAAATLMLMITFVSATNMVELKNATFWRKHTIQVILLSHAFGENLVDIQRGTRGYVTLGDTNALASYSNSARLEPRQFNQLVELTSDNPVQQQRLKELARTMDRVFSYNNRVIALYNQQGSKAVFEMDAAGQGRIEFGNARDIVRAISQEERRLLDVRDASEQTDSDSASHLLIFGSVIAAGLLMLANFNASREVKRRRQSEEALQKSEVRMRLATETAGVAVWDWNPRSGAIYWDEQMFKIYGRTPMPGGWITYQHWRAVVLPEDFAEQEEQLQRTVATCGQSQREFRIVRASDGAVRFIQAAEIAVAGDDGQAIRLVGINLDITERKLRETEREKLISELQLALGEVKTLSGLIPICGWCKSIRSDQGFWQSVEVFVQSRSGATFSHGMCPACSKKFNEEMAHDSVVS